MRGDRPVGGVARVVGAAATTPRDCAPSVPACVEGFAGAVSVVKPQVAFFERHGSAGMAELERLIAEATAAGLIVIADAKRGDIDSTAAAYADAWLGDASPLAVDAVTAHPYLGLGALAPLVQLGRGQRDGASWWWPAARTPRVEASSRRSPPGDPGVEDMLLAEIAELNGSPEVPTGRSVRSSGPRWSGRPSRCPSSEG